MRKFLKQLSASKLKIAISSLGIFVLIAFSAIMIFQMTKVEVAFAADGKEQTIQTHAKTVADLLKELDIDMGKHDAISHQLDEQLINGMSIEYTTAKDITLTIDDQDQQYITTAETVGEFLKNEDLSVSEHDEVAFKESDKIVDGMHLEMAKAFQLTINNGGKKKKVWATSNQTYREVLAANDITYKNKDKINQNLDEKAKPGKQLNITNVAYETVEKTERVPFQVVKKYDDNLEKGKQLVKQEGQDGKLRKVYQVTKENNKKVKEKYVKTISEQEAKHKIIVIGTKEPEAALAVASMPQKSKKQMHTDNKPASKPAPVGSKPEKSGKTLRMVASAYTGDCSGCSGYTATGINLKANPNAKVIAVDPNVIPLGTRVWVEGYGTAIAGDTGGAIHGNRIDLHVPSVSAAHAFGTRTVTVKILD